MTALEKFEQDLLDLIGKPTDLRPFVCDGSPLTHKVFIVGFNPATEMSADFWEFWRAGYGFDKQAWFDAYLKERQGRPLKLGKTRRPAVSNTRRVIDWILQAAHPIKCLETNIYSVPTERASDLAPEPWMTKPFDFLLEAVKPDLVIVHGKEAAKALLKGKKIEAKVIPFRHFSRGWSEEAARELGRVLRECAAIRGQ